jgi:tetratricopeptide (TPR) repeat protein
MTTILVLLSLLAADAQQHDSHAPAAEKPATLMTGLGRLHHPIATRSAEAQRFFDQGLTLVYGFNHDEAMRSFRRAAELDPASPMPHWGIALALGPNINLDVDPEREQAAYGEAQRAHALASSAPANECAYVDALVTRYSNDPKADLKALAVRYKDAMRTGNYEGAVTSNAKAADVDRAYINSTGAAGVYPSMYYNHNLDFLASAAMMSGQFKEAKLAADMVVANTTPMIAQMPMLEPFGAKTLYVRLRFARWDEVLALPQPDAKHTLLTTLSHFGRGVALAARGSVADAEKERAAYADARKVVVPDSDWGYNKAKDMLAVTDAVLDAWIARAKRDDGAAIEAWRRAVAAEDALNYDEPADWFYPTRESLGAALLRATRVDEAAQVFREDLTRNPKNGRSLFGLWQTLLVKGNDPATAATRRQFREAWKHADVTVRLADF